MKIEYYPDVDVLTITLRETPFEAEGEDAGEDADVILYYDQERRLAEIEVSQASRRTSLDVLRQSPVFEEVQDAGEAKPLKVSSAANL